MLVSLDCPGHFHQSGKEGFCVHRLNFLCDKMEFGLMPHSFKPIASSTLTCGAKGKDLPIKYYLRLMITGVARQNRDGDFFRQTLQAEL